MNALKFALVALAVTLLGCVTLSAKADPVAFTLQDMNEPGGQYDSAAHLGKPIVLEFFHEWCGPCNTNAANVKSMAHEWHGARAQIIEVGLDCAIADYVDWINRHRPVTPVLKDCEGRALAMRLGVTRYPTTIVLDRNHVEAWRMSGIWYDAHKARIRQTLQNNQPE